MGVHYRVVISGRGPKPPDLMPHLVALGGRGHLVRKVEPTDAERFDGFVDFNGPMFNETPCWIWKGSAQ